MDFTTDQGRRELGIRIQAAIARAGYDSLAVFAEALGCSRALIYQYVSGDVLAQLDRLQLIAQLTDCSLEWFFASGPEGRSADVERLERETAERSERIQQLERALLGERGSRIEGDERSRRAQLDLLIQLCGAYRIAGTLQALSEAALQAMELARSLGDDTALMRASVYAGHASTELGRHDRAREHLAKAIELASELGDERARQSAVQELIRVHRAQGRLDEALALARELADSDRWWSRWSARLSLAALAEQSGDLPGARAWVDEAEGVIAEPDAPPEHLPMARTFVQSNRANLSLAAGRYQDALRDSELLASLAGAASAPDQLREATLNLAVAHMRMGHLDEATECLQRAGEWAAMAGDSRLELLVSVFRGELFTRLGNLAEAKHTCLNVLDAANETGTGHTIAEAELALAGVYLAEGSLADAAHQFERCRRRAERLSLRRLQLAAALGVAELAVLTGEANASELLGQVTEDAKQLGYDDLRDRALAVGETGHSRGTPQKT